MDTIVLDEHGRTMKCLKCHNKVKALRTPIDCPHCKAHSPVWTYTVTILETHTKDGIESASYKAR